MELSEQRRAENFAIMCPLKDIEDGDMLAFLATLMQDHDHLREKLETEPDLRKRNGKFEAMRPHLPFQAHKFDVYYMASMAKQCGAQPIYQETEDAERFRMTAPVSQLRVQE